LWELLVNNLSAGPADNIPQDQNAKWHGGKGTARRANGTETWVIVGAKSSTGFQPVHLIETTKPQRPRSGRREIERPLRVLRGFVV
jgi:hypothetical protein